MIFFDLLMVQFFFVQQMKTDLQCSDPNAQQCPSNYSGVEDDTHITADIALIQCRVALSSRV